MLAATAGGFKTHDYLSYRNLASLLPRPMRGLRCRMAMLSSFASSSYTAPTRRTRRRACALNHERDRYYLSEDRARVPTVHISVVGKLKLCTRYSKVEIRLSSQPGHIQATPRELLHVQVNSVRTIMYGRIHFTLTSHVPISRDSHASAPTPPTRNGTRTSQRPGKTLRSFSWRFRSRAPCQQPP